ncbi:TonB-dependent receptor plug domain-containing protein [Microbacter margulisiae]|uniref:TonB-dependent receptor plug domain-containing protein n=1 Tax=Microbacter margulisiae TaxID=1350067 RepID=A0A7W5DS94_9PORP|nr:TonB-dependent receptor plug domain-containing protein [Microbacter margulisiae]MBB3187966.1 hypothetical protein [Microbacter margulisiae]
MRNFLLIIGLLFGSSPLFSQTINNESFIDNVIHQFQRLDQLPVEKLYLQTDKPYYNAGENIWYSAYLVNGMNLHPDAFSKFVYVELINKSDSVCYRQKLKQDSLGFYGNMLLPASLSAGEYILRAYTWWMQNAGPAYFFQRKIKIGNSIDNEITSTIRYENDNGMLLANISFTTNPSISLHNLKVDYELYEGNKRVRSKSLPIDETNHLQFGFEEDTSSNVPYHIVINFENPKYSYSHVFFVPQKQTTFSLQFFPEGGNWLNNGYRTLAFKAIGQNGLSVNVSGTIYNDMGDSITSFDTMHKGMGITTFYVSDSSSVHYYALATINGTHTSKRFNLPPVLHHGVGLSMSLFHQQWRYQIISTDPRFIPQHLYLLAQNSGKLLFIQPVDSLHLEGEISTETLPNGIIHFVLLNAQGQALSQRLVFVNNPIRDTLSVTTDKPYYYPRQKVQLAFLNHIVNSLAKAHISVAVTDNRTVKLDSLANNIYTDLLLTSDLKGYVEDPGYYFVSNSRQRTRALDMLMLTQGWTRFNIPDILDEKFSATPYYMEEGQSLSGSVTNIIGKPAKDAQIIALEIGKKLVITANADQTGHFILNNLSFPDSSLFLVQARTKHGYATVDIHIDKENFPSVEFSHPFGSPHILPDNYLQQTDQQYYMNGGEKIYHLKEITVTASMHQSLDDNEIYAGLGNPIQGKDLEKYFSSGQTVLDVLQTLPGIRITGDVIQYRGSKGNPLLVVDDIEYQNMGDDELDMLRSLNIAQVAYINFLHGTDASIYGGLGGNGVIIVKLKSGGDLFASTPANPGLAIVRYLGYKRPAQFYSPVYKTEAEKTSAVPDLRTTIYWNPAIVLPASKPIKCSFYTADKPGIYTATIEGITDKGVPLHVQMPIIVKAR